MNKHLKNYYEEKYSEDKHIENIQVIPYCRYPVTRHEACIKYFTDQFKGGGILELGAGNGTITKSLLGTELNINRYMASDLSENRLQAIQNNISDNRLEVKRIDVENLDQESLPSFDAIIMVALIEHLIDPISAMKYIRQILKPEGFVYIDTPNIADYGNRLKLLRGKFPSTASKNEGLTTYYDMPVTLHDEGHLHYFTYRSLSRMLIDYAGFTKTEKYYFPVGRIFLGKAIHHLMARIKPELFSMLVMIARK